ncbi:discoidin domain-containing protein [Paenibacillus sp. UMB4589-SE434]|uniref:discoidin domain-containing protein n=1 Tax=Paenibacillus sp. UMB4589-SE434 TaxID=3046314 RepID=UPI00254B260E|nr:discoidin domain-containing protein [Paenibacillus sp. UMB4589-SE434]MDK8183259.1 discoidin domain-containing protein [Paenibacillus sp. UMB4589-SE434]
MYRFDNYFNRHYLNCRKLQLLYSMLQKGIQVDYMFYNVYEDSAAVYEEAVLNKTTRPQYPSLLMSETEHFGKVYVYDAFDTFDEAFDHVRRLLSEQKDVFVWTKGKYLPHVERTTIPPEGSHSFTITSYNEQEDTFHIHDEEYEADYKRAIIATAYEGALPQIRSIAYLDLEQIVFDDSCIKLFHEAMKQHMAQIDCSFPLYPAIQQLLQGNLMHFADMQEACTHVVEALSILSGSRILFSKYIKIMNYPEPLAEAYSYVSDRIELCKYMILASIMSRQINPQLALEIEKLQTIEQHVLAVTKEIIINGAAEHVYDEFIIPTSIPQVEYSPTDNKLNLSWDEPQQNLWAASYHCYQHTKFLGKTTSPQIQLSNYDSRSPYGITLKVVDAFGRPVKDTYHPITLQETKALLIDKALYKTVSASSEETHENVRQNVVDGNPYTRWSSERTDQEWICIDLEEQTLISRVRLHWESAHAKAYKLQISDNATHWTDIYETSSSLGGIEIVDGLNIQGRYIRMQGIERASIWGYSLWAFNVY